ncbi:hypothetical protein B9Z55_028935 [Caenorhabditis nigoni]|uniref:Uncharacterized protein n=1 Tax=Caenorhabditis nigoni TaxID=1611254 RepID=A0A2G5S9S6_9PELO|nr:hypothetical protein B9Z55_028935 [Caenorhabditis nigoni]
MFRHVAQNLGSKSTSIQTCRGLRTRWERGYLKDLYHRRQILGADPEVPDLPIQIARCKCEIITALVTNSLNNGLLSKRALTILRTILPLTTRK